MQTLKEYLAILAYLIGIAAAIFTWWQYHRNSARERARWLSDLYQRFYNNPELKQMAALIDWQETGFIRDEKDRKLLEQLDEYLNFFEFIAYLRKRKQLEEKEIRSMFDYPLQKIAEDKGVLGYLRRLGYSYEGLDELLKELGYAE